MCEKVEKRRKRGHAMCGCSVNGKAGVLRMSTLILRELARRQQATEVRTIKQNLSLHPCTIFVQSVCLCDLAMSISGP